MTGISNHQAALTAMAHDYGRELYAKLVANADADGLSNNGGDFAFVATLTIANMTTLQLIALCETNPVLAKAHRDLLLTQLENSKQWLK